MACSSPFGVIVVLAVLLAATAPTPTLSGTINVVVSTASTSVTGSHQMVIDSSLQQQFGLGTSQTELRSVIGRHEGRTPTNAYVKSPASNGDWPDLYNRYGWAQVTSTATASTLTNFRETGDSRVVIARAEYENKSNVTVTIRETLTHAVEDSVEKTYSSEVGFRVSHNFNVGVKFFQGGWEISMEARFGYAHTQRKSSSVGSSTEVAFEMGPRQAVVVEIVSKLTSGQATFRYNARLAGYVATNFNPTHQGSHFWGIPVGNVLNSIGQPNPKTVTQTIKAGYYITKNVVISDKKTGEVLQVFEVPDETAQVFIRQEGGQFHLLNGTDIAGDY